MHIGAARIMAVCLAGLLVSSATDDAAGRRLAPDPAGGRQLAPLTQPGAREWDISPAFGPKGQFLYFQRVAEEGYPIYQKELRSGREKRIVPVGEWAWPTADGKALVYKGIEAIGVYDLRSGKNALFRLGEDDMPASRRFVTWAPQFQHPTYVPPGVLQLHPDFATAGFLMWSPSRSKVALLARRVKPSGKGADRRRLRRRYLVIVEKRPGGQYRAVRSIKRVEVFPRYVNQTGSGWGPDSQRFYFPGVIQGVRPQPSTARPSKRPRHQIMVLDLKSRKITPVSSGPFDREVTCSPDGKWIAYTRFSQRGTTRVHHVVICKPDGSQVRIIEEPALRNPIWSPDSSYLVAASKAKPGESAPLWTVPVEESKAR